MDEHLQEVVKKLGESIAHRSLHQAPELPPVEMLDPLEKAARETILKPPPTILNGYAFYFDKN